MSELTEIKTDVKDLRFEVRENTKVTQDGFAKVNGRISNLEIDKARREGKESILKPNSNADWKKITFGLLGIMATSVSIAYVILQAVLK